MNIHKIELTGYCAKSPEGPVLYLGTAGSYGNEQLAVTLGKGWQGLTVTATFQPSGVPALVPGDGTFDVPWEATETALDAAKGRIVFEGVTDGRVLISTDIPYVVGSHSDTEGGNSQPPTPSQWEQFVDEVKGDADRAEKAAKDAEATLQDVKDAGAQAVTDIGAAKDSALDAIAKAGEEAAGSITADVEGAKQAAAQAEQSAKDAAATLEKVQSAGQSALDDIATERQNTLFDIQNEGAKQQSAVAGAGTAALEAIGQTEQAAINQIKQTGETQVGAVQSAGTTQISQINSAGAAQVQTVKDEGAAQTSALDDAAAAHKNELESIASHPPRPNTETGKWQVWNAETGAYQDTDALYQGGYYTPAVSDDGVLTWQGSLPEMPAIPGANINGPKGDKGDPGLGVPTPTQADAGKVPMVNEDGTGYVLREVSAGGGDAGQPGTDGEDGGYYKPSLDSAGNLSWQASKPGMPDVPEANIRGPQGPQGEPGADGKDGEQGPAGAPGADGTTPTIGPNGNWYLGEIDTGKPSRGEQGPQGEGGGYYTPSVDSEGNLSWTASKADMSSVPGTNIQGPEGPQGETGATPQLTIGTVTTLDPGEDATASITGTAEAPVLNFGIPKGEPGEGSTGGSDLPATTAADRGKAPTVNAAGTGYELTGPYAPLSAAIRPTASGNPVSITDSVEWPLLGLKVYGKSTQVTTTGAQLIDTQAWQTADSEYYKIAEDGGMIQLKEDGRALGRVPTFLELEAGYYTTSVTTGFVLQIIKDGVQLVSTVGGSSTTFTLDSPATIGMKVYMNPATNKYPSPVAYPMINAGSTVKPWEPYTGGKPSPSPEYSQPIVSAGDGGSIDLTVSNSADQSQSLTISTPNGLPGIPVDSGGNYTDAEGQQWVCDVKDYGTGKYTQMVGHIESYNGENITTPYMSTTGQLSTGAEVYYVLNEPVVTDISADELTAYRALHTYDGATVVSTAEDVAGLEVRYVANAQKYIDDRLAAAESHIQEIAAAQLNAQTGG